MWIQELDTGQEWEEAHLFSVSSFVTTNQSYFKNISKEKSYPHKSISNKFQLHPGCLGGGRGGLYAHRKLPRFLAPKSLFSHLLLQLLCWSPTTPSALLSVFMRPPFSTPKLQLCPSFKATGWKLPSPAIYQKISAHHGNHSTTWDHENCHIS